MNKFRKTLDEIITILFAIAIAIIIWGAAYRDSNPDASQYYILPVNLINKPADAVVSLERTDVSINIEGPKNLINELSPDYFSVSVDLKNAPMGQESEQPLTVTFNPPANLPVGQLSKYDPNPQSIVINLEPKITKLIPVVANIQGSIPTGYTQDKPIINPPMIEVSGPASEINKINEARISPTLNNDKTTRTFNIEPIYYDRSGGTLDIRHLDRNPATVDITIPIEQAANFVQKIVNVDWTGQPAPGYRVVDVKAVPESVLVTGTPADLNKLLQLNTTTIDISNMRNSYSGQVNLVLTDTIAAVDETSVFVTLQIEPIISSNTLQKEIAISGLAPELTATLKPKIARVFFEGPISIVDNLKPADISISVNLFDLQPGVYQLDLSYSIPSISPDEVKILAVQPAQISVIITTTIPISPATSIGETELESFHPITNKSFSHSNGRIYNGHSAFKPSFLRIPLL